MFRWDKRLGKAEEFFYDHAGIYFSTVVGIATPILAAAAVGMPAVMIATTAGSLLGGGLAALLTQSNYPELDCVFEGKSFLPTVGKIAALGSLSSALLITAIPTIMNGTVEKTIQKHLKADRLDKVPELSQPFPDKAKGVDARGNEWRYVYDVKDVRETKSKAHPEASFTEVDVAGTVERPSLFSRHQRTLETFRATISM